jgi:hypothetical protein
MQGAGTAGFFVSAFLLVFNTYGIWKASLAFYNIPLAPFVIVGLFSMVGVYWGAGFLIERIGLYKEMQSHMNREVNPEWVDAYSKIKKIADMLGVE